MKILLVEDQNEKASDVSEFLNQLYGIQCQVYIKESLKSGLREVVKNRGYELIVLDMSMPSFDPSGDDPNGGKPESFAGISIMDQMKIREIHTPVIVVTQYSEFNDGKITLSILDNTLQKNYSDFYLGAVYYSSASTSWKTEMTSKLTETINK